MKVYRNYLLTRVSEVPPSFSSAMCVYTLTDLLVGAKSVKKINDRATGW